MLYTLAVSEGERDQLRARVALGVATGEERDRLAGMIVRAIRERDDAELEQIESLLDELRALVGGGSDRSSCTDALTGALLDAQIRAFERGDAADAWRRLDELRARLLLGGAPDLLQDRLAAALYNTVRGGELLHDEPMRLAALEELRTRANGDLSASACRVALAELLADAIGDAIRLGENEQVADHRAELERLRELDKNHALTREYSRALAQLLTHEDCDEPTLLSELRELAESDPRARDDVHAQLAEGLVCAHARALRADDELRAEVLREQLRTLLSERNPSTASASSSASLSESSTSASRATARARRRGRVAIMRAWGRALHDAAVLGLGREDVDHQDQRLSETAERAARALAELRVIVDQNETDIELRALLMSALFQVHRNAIETGVADAAEHIQAEADALLAREDELGPTRPARSSSLLRRRRRGTVQRETQLRAQLHLDHLRMLLATHASAGDREDWVRAELLLTRARNLVDRADRPLEMVEILGQMLVNAHVDTGTRNAERPAEDRSIAARALLVELRSLARMHPHSGLLQLHLATALFNAHVDAGSRHASAEAELLVHELEQLHEGHPSLIELRRRLVMALVNHHGDCLDREDDFAAEECLERVRELVHAPGADEHLRVQLAMALGNALGQYAEPNEDDEGQRIVNELRMLATREDASPTLRALVLNELSGLFAPQQ